MPERRVHIHTTHCFDVPVETCAFPLVVVFGLVKGWGMSGTGGGADGDVCALRVGRLVVLKSFILWEIST